MIIRTLGNSILEMMAEQAKKKPETGAPAPKIIRSQDLFGAAKQLLIEHRNSYHRLLITRQGKLILNK